MTISPEKIIDLIGELGRAVFWLLDDCETSGEIGQEVHTITTAGLSNVSAVLDQIDCLPFQVPGLFLGPGAKLQEAIKQTFLPDSENRALIDVMKERARQQSEEGWTFDHDDTHIQGELAAAAACYALWASDVAPLDGLAPPTSDKVMQFWPFAPAWFKVQFRRTALIKAGALILAELDRLDRKYRTEEEPF